MKVLHYDTKDFLCLLCHSVSGKHNGICTWFDLLWCWPCVIWGNFLEIPDTESKDQLPITASIRENSQHPAENCRAKRCQPAHQYSRCTTGIGCFELSISLLGCDLYCNAWVLPSVWLANRPCKDFSKFVPSLEHCCSGLPGHEGIDGVLKYAKTCIFPSVLENFHWD